MEIVTIILGTGRKWLDGLPFWYRALSIGTTTCNTEVLSRSKKKQVTVSPVFPVHSWRKNGKCQSSQKQYQSSQITEHSAPYVESLVHYVLKTELMLTMFSNSEKKAGREDAASWWVACLTHTFLQSVYNLIINLIDLAWHMV